ncbi:MmgE/PrpD family protein [Roseovarius tibetensis]|uniref:MmgE/PrpD family protein n=1 Tax=Roseovarius tibetensis TaxID=2685897 RepID=UPI003D7FE161
MSKSADKPAAAGAGGPVLRDLVGQAARADIPDAALDKASVCFADFLSCSLEAADLPWSRQAAGLAAGRSGPAVIVGETDSVSPEDAAFANAVRGHGLVREDMHTGSIAHMGVVIWPVLMALAPEAKPSGRDVLGAAVAGYEIGGRLGRVLMTPEVARLFRPTGLIGPLSGTLAGAMLLGLTEDEKVSALAFAANCASGLNQWPHTGADEMYFHPGFAARNAITAIRLAQLGASGSDNIIEGDAGLVAAIRRVPFTERISLYPDGACEILSVFNKEVPACNFAQSPCQAALAARHRLEPGESIRSVRVTTYDAALNYPGCAHTGPFATPLQAKMSIAFGVAAALVRGEIADTNYGRLNDPEITRMISRIGFDLSDALTAAYPARQGVRLCLETEGGRKIEETLDDIRFATPDMIRRRLSAVAASRLGADRAGCLCEHLDSLASATDFNLVVQLSRQEPEEAK